MLAAEEIVRTLIDSGIGHLFGLPGGAVIPIYDKLLDHQGELKHILVRHEQGAAHAADAYARVTGKPGVCLATSGPGATNLVTGIMTAYMDSSPLIAMAGQVPTDLIGKDAFQETDMIGTTMQLTKHNFLLRSPNDVRATIECAFEIAMQGRKGPVYIDIPKDVQLEEVESSGVSPGVCQSYKAPIPNAQNVVRAVDLVLSAERPLFLLGGGVILSGASAEVRSLIELVNAPVVTTVMGKGAFPESHPLCLGTIGMHGRRLANYALTNSDLLVVIGARWSDRTSGQPELYEESHKIIHIDIDPAEMHKNAPVDVSIIADAKRAATVLRSAIIKKGMKRGDSAWNRRIRGLLAYCNCYEEKTSDTTNGTLSVQKAMFMLRRLIRDTDIVTTGVGQHQMFASYYLRREHPRTFITSGGAGTMGFGLPAAIGAKVAAPKVNVFDIDGDGSFNMTAQELGTCKQHNLKIIIIVFNNGYLGMVRQWLELFMDKRYSEVQLTHNPNFVQLARAYGLDGVTVTRPSEFENAIRQGLSGDSTFVIDCLVPEEENILPMMPPGCNVDDSFGGCMEGNGRFFSDEVIRSLGVKW
jgi:acetolactate synthase-1/2/3 large subunit